MQRCYQKHIASFALWESTCQKYTAKLAILKSTYRTYIVNVTFLQYDLYLPALQHETRDLV